MRSFTYRIPKKPVPYNSFFKSAPGLGRIVAFVLYPFEADRDDVLTVKECEKLTVVDTEEFDGWWTCRNSKGEEGIVPALYLEARVQVEL